MTQLWLEGHRMDMGTSKVAQTFQVNDINELRFRQATHSNKFKLPMTPHNVKVFDMLGISGSQSLKPYRKLDAKLTRSSIELVSRGWAIVEETTNSYEVTVYDGYIHFIKAIENQVITNVGISELNHLKNLTTVQASWDPASPYRYIVADYNGKMLYDIIKLNLDYLVPSVNVKWLWDKIFAYFGWEYEGSVFDTEAFQNLWMTYPKSIGESSQTYTEIYNKNWSQQLFYYPSGSIYPAYMPYLTGGNNETQVEGALLGSELESTFAGGSITMRNFAFTAITGVPVKVDISGYFNQTDEQTKTVLVKVNNEVVSSLEVTGDEEFSLIHNQYLEQGDVLTIEAQWLLNGNTTGYVTTIISTIDGNTVDFEDALIDYQVRDFIQEIMWRFALTPFTDKHTNKVKFLTHREWLQAVDNDDWSDKFVKRLSENYIVGRYGQRSWLRNTYNDNKQSHNDGYLYIDNKNLQDSVDIIRSSIFSPEPTKESFMGGDRNIYRLWNKENKDDGTVDYKELSGRFYFMRSDQQNMAITIGSEFQGNETAINTFPIASYERLSFVAIVEDYYRPIYSILNRAKLITAELNLNELDINALKFEKLKYIKQLGSYFILNKINNFLAPGNVSCELVQVEYGTDEGLGEITLPPQILIDASTAEPNGTTLFNWMIVTDYAFLNYVPVGATIYIKQLDASPADGGAYTGLEYSSGLDISASLYNQTMPLPLNGAEGWYEVQVIDSDGLESNIDYVFIGSDDVATSNIEVMLEITGEIIYAEEHQRDISYRFNNFTPVSATLTVESWNFAANAPFAEGNSETLTALTADTWHTFSDFQFPYGYGYYRVTIATDTITYQQILTTY